MKLSELPDGLWKQISRDEHDLERPVIKAALSVTLEGKNKTIILHEWEYTRKEVI